MAFSNFPFCKSVLTSDEDTIFLLVKSGFATRNSLIKARPYLIILFLIIGMLLTPPDIFSQLFLAIPMWVLFEIGIILAKK